MTKKQTAFTTLLFAAIGMVLFFAFDFSGDYAINDDWGYTTPIRWWVDEGRLALTHWQSMPFFTQFLFGVAWAEIFGFSQGGLRQLTLIFALVTCVAVFICARSFRLPVSLSVLCAVLPFASPIFVGLSYSFMTDVPAAAFVTLSLLFFVLSFIALDKGDRYYALGVAFLLLAVLLRQTALAVALALVVAEPVARGFSLSRTVRPLGVLVATVLTYFAFNALLEAHVGLPRIYSTKSDALMVFVGDLLAGNFGAIRHSLKALLIAFAQFGLFAWPLLPILCCVLWQRGRWFILGALGGAVLLTILSLIMDVGVLSEADGNLMTGAGLGPRNIGPALPVRGLPVGVVTWIGHFGLVSSVLACGIGLLQQGRDQAHTPGIRGGMLLLALTALLTFAPHMVAYGPLLDRYALLPSILLVLVVFRAVGPDAIPQVVLRFSAGLIGIGFVVSLLLTADFFRWQDARYALIGRLVSSGVAADQIDGGFEYNNLAAVLEGPALSMLLVDPSDRPIRLKSAPGPDDVVVSVEEFSRFFGAGVGHIYAVR